MTVTEGNPEVQDASIPQEAPAAPESTPAGRAHERLFGEDAAPAADAATPEPTPETPPAPETPPTEDADTRISRLYAQATESESQMRVAQTANTELKQRLDMLEARERAMAEDPYAALRERGLDPRDFIKRELGMEDEPPTAEEIAATAVERVEALEKRDQERHANAQEHVLVQRQATIGEQVKGFLKSNGFDSINASAPAVQRISQQLFKMEQDGSFKGHTKEAISKYCRDLAESVDKQLATEVQTYIQSEGVIDRLLADEATATRIREKLGAPAKAEPNGGQATDAAAGDGNEPTTISDGLATQVGSKVEPLNGGWTPMEARRRAAVAIAKGFAVDG